MFISNKLKNLSVTTFIHTLFSITITILIVTFLLFLSWDKDRQKIEEVKRYQLIAITFLSNLRQSPSSKNLERLYKNLKVSPVSSEEKSVIKKQIMSKGKTIFTGGSRIGKVRVFDVDKKRYIYVQRMGYTLMLKDKKTKNFNFEYAIAIGVFLISLLLLLYVAILKKLYPLKRLHKQIQKFAHGDLHTRISYEYDDEIGKIAKSFDDAIIHIHELSTSKNLFMRNVMHELKTPITKGRIVVEMLEDEETKSVLIRAFERMNELISELATLERVTTQSFEPNFEYVMLSEILKVSQELLMTQSSLIHIDIDDRALTTDKKLMALAIKNLLDNGIKYGNQKSVLLKTNQDVIEIISEGKKLEHDFAYYTEPFSQEEKRSAGFGLGLYIVNNILKKLRYRLAYKHENGNNIFFIMPERRRVQRD